MCLVWHDVNGVKKQFEQLKEYSNNGVEFAKLDVNGRVVKFIKQVRLLDKNCIIDMFNMSKVSRLEYTRGFILLEVKVIRGKELYTLYRLNKDSDVYEVEIATTFNADDIVVRLYHIGSDKSVSWDVSGDIIRLANKEMFSVIGSKRYIASKI